MSSGDLVMQEEIIYIYMILCYDSRRRCKIYFYNKGINSSDYADIKE